jgi:hypothetical protein
MVPGKLPGLSALPETRSKSTEDISHNESPGGELTDRALPVASAPPTDQSWAPAFDVENFDFDGMATVHLSESMDDDETGTVVASEDGSDGESLDGSLRLSVLEDMRQMSRSTGRLHSLCEEEEDEPLIDSPLDCVDADTKSL